MEYDFVPDGFCSLGRAYDPKQCQALLEQVHELRDFDDLFLEEEEFRRDPQMKGVNPRSGRNLLAKLGADFVFENPTFDAAMRRLLGYTYRPLDYKFVMGVPDTWLPAWLVEETKGLAVANLGPYIRPEHRDITYFHGIDFHQDLIDFKNRPADFVTAYVYLSDTDESTSPLYVVPRSHEWGATTFPHNLSERNGMLHYVADEGEGDYEKLMLTGPAGSLYCWHPLTLHGTKPHRADKPRISIRILVERAAPRPHGTDLDLANDLIRGPISLLETRQDLDESGTARIRGNKINTLA